jgi:hypothetical protein
LSRPLYYYVNPASLDDSLRSFLEWARQSEGQSVVTFVGYYPAPKTEAAKALPTVKLRAAPARQPISLTPDNMDEHGFDLAVKTSDPGDALRSGEAVLTMHLNLAADSAPGIRTLSLRLGEDMDLPFNLKSALRQALLEKTSLYLVAGDGADDGEVYVVRPVVFSGE